MVCIHAFLSTIWISPIYIYNHVADDLWAKCLSKIPNQWHFTLWQTILLVYYTTGQDILLTWILDSGTSSSSAFLLFFAKSLQREMLLSVIFSKPVSHPISFCELSLALISLSHPELNNRLLMPGFMAVVWTLNQVLP